MAIFYPDKMFFGGILRYSSNKFVKIEDMLGTGYAHIFFPMQGNIFINNFQDPLITKIPIQGRDESEIARAVAMDADVDKAFDWIAECSSAKICHPAYMYRKKTRFGDYQNVLIGVRQHNEKISYLIWKALTTVRIDDPTKETYRTVTYYTADLYDESEHMKWRANESLASKTVIELMHKLDGYDPLPDLNRREPIRYF